MKNQHRFRTVLSKVGLTSAIAACLALASAPGVANAQSTSSDAYQTAVDYVTTFYPLWFTYNQSQKSTANQLVGPVTVSPIYQTVVAVNVDTLYASSFMQLPSDNAAILTVPSTNVVFSVLILDPYGNVIQTNVNFKNGGVFAFVGPNGYDQSQGALPPGATQVNLPVAYPTIIFRADKYSSSGVDQTQAAETFRSSLKMQSFSLYNSPNPPPSQTQIVSESTYAFPFKVVADTELSITPRLFLSQLMTAVASSRTPPLSADNAALSEHFNELYSEAGAAADLAAGASAAHQQILQNYLGHRDANGWIDFTNIGIWEQSDVIDRASITEYIQYGNSFTSAAYFHVFVDGDGQALDGSKSGYVINFPPGQPPMPDRFWSITAYTPEAVELVPNPLQKYNVASYTPGLKYNPDGSLTIYVGTSQPEGAPEANYLPAPAGPFNLMLRFYGPEGQVKAQTYVPPPVVREN